MNKLEACHIKNIIEIKDLTLGKRTRDMKEESSLNREYISKNSIDILHIKLPIKPNGILPNENEILFNSQQKDCLLKSSIILLPKDDDWGWYINTEKCIQN